MCLDIDKEEIKECIKDLKLIKANLKKLCSLMRGNHTRRMETMLESDSDFEVKSKTLDHKCLSIKVNTIV